MTSIWSWSQTAADNDDADSSIVWLENQAPSTVNNSARQMMGRVAEMLADAAPLRASTGAANVYSVTINSAPGTWVNGMRFSFRAHQANTSSAIVSVNGYSTKPLRRRSGVALAPGEIDSGAPLTCVYVQATDEVLIVAGQAPAVGTSADVVARIVRTGTVMAWTSATVPAGWLECNGAAISRATYAELYQAIGTTYGVGDGSTTFNIPDYRGEFLRGWANGSSNDPDRTSRTNRGDGTTGDAVGTKQASATGSHTHSASLAASVSGTLNTTATASGGTLAVSVSGTLNTTATLTGGSALDVSVSGSQSVSASGTLSVSASGSTDLHLGHSHTYTAPSGSVLYGAGGSGSAVASTTSATSSTSGSHSHSVSVSGNATGTLTGSTSGTLTGTATGTVTGTATGTLTGAATGTLTGTATGTLTGTATGTTGATGGNETRPRNVNVMWIILALPAQASAANLGVGGLSYQFSSTTTDADPSAGRLRFNHATPASVTQLYVSETDAYGADLTGLLQSFLAGSILYLFRVGAPQHYAAFTVAASVTDAAGYKKITVTHTGSSGSFSDGDPLAVVVFGAGATGATGAAGPQGLNWQGTWVISTAYVENDGVSRNGSAYICTQAHTSAALTEPGTGASWASYWDVLSVKGSDGIGAGTVTSVDVSGGTTGLTTSGGPVTASGTITLTGTLAVANGGTGATSAADARTNLGVQALDATLTALAGYNTNGLLTQTAADTFTGRTITGGAAISVTDGNGVSGNPTIALTSSGLSNVTSFNSGDKMLVFEGGTPKLADYDDLPSSGTVTSVGLTMPAEFSVAGSPVTTSGTLAVTKANQSANLMFAGPTSGGAAAPTFRALVAADLPAASDTAQGALEIATTAEIAAASSTTVAITPGRAQRHPSAAKAYLHLNAAQTTINKSFNVTSVTDSATGDAAVNFTTAFDSSTYAIAAMPQEIIAAGTNPVLICQAECTSASASRLVSSYGGNGVTVTFYDTLKGAAYYGILA